MDNDVLGALFTCPRCQAPVDDLAGRACGKPGCPKPFPVVSGQPVLVDFETSVLDRARFVATAATSIVQAREVGLVRRIVRRLVGGSNAVAGRNAAAFLAAVKARAVTPRVLVVGGGVVGAGFEAVLQDQAVRVASFDVYVSDHTQFVADAHAIPLADASFDAVWIQAVLEHVVEPAQVVSEIHRVLAPAGVVYAETPFLQGVHEGAYDYTRFTHSGHRYLFRMFDEIASGPVGGPGTSLLWAIRGLWRSVTSSDRAASLLTLPFAWVTLADRLFSRGAAIDFANGVYFLGQKRASGMSHREIAAYYAGRGPR